MNRIIGFFYIFSCNKNFKLEGKTWNKHFNFPFYMGVIDDTYLSYEIEQSIIDLTTKYTTKDIICQYKGKYFKNAWVIE